MESKPKPQGCTNLKLRQITRRVTQHFDAELVKTGLKTTQYSLLSHVLRLGPIRAVDLAVAMRMSTSTLSRNLQPLIASGWIETKSGHDARSRLICVVSADVILTHLAEVKLTHLGKDGGFFAAENADSGASSGNQGIGTTWCAD